MDSGSKLLEIEAAVAGSVGAEGKGARGWVLPDGVDGADGVALKAR